MGKLPSEAHMDAYGYSNFVNVLQSMLAHHLTVHINPLERVRPKTDRFPLFTGPVSKLMYNFMAGVIQACAASSSLHLCKMETTNTRVSHDHNPLAARRKKTLLGRNRQSWGEPPTRLVQVNWAEPRWDRNWNSPGFETVMITTGAEDH